MVQTRSSSPNSSFSGVHKSTRVRPKRKLLDTMEENNVIGKYLERIESGN
ncbi:hypothetical protein PanWU01x14_013870 [Parasponia andersonii]|uniref:Uncharacterized protein n=1 Tax=Parasponia andersonii TaxID=3476 RepID=A0A2P5E157_PARAD|nr:hypothetical protein PanWU01x14_013870 [Parasponia andersonii]